MRHQSVWLPSCSLSASRSETTLGNMRCLIYLAGWTAASLLTGSSSKTLLSKILQNKYGSGLGLCQATAGDERYFQGRPWSAVVPHHHVTPTWSEGKLVCVGHNATALTFSNSPYLCHISTRRCVAQPLHIVTSQRVFTVFKPSNVGFSVDNTRPSFSACALSHNYATTTITKILTGHYGQQRLMLVLCSEQTVFSRKRCSGWWFLEIFLYILKAFHMITLQKEVTQSWNTTVSLKIVMW